MNLLTQTESEAQTTRRVVVPRYNVNETADAFVVTAYVPGVDRSALETHVDGENLTVSARRTWKLPEGWTSLHRETAENDYRLVLEIDQSVNREAIRAELNQGVLTLKLPKAEAVKPRRIEITG